MMMFCLPSLSVSPILWHLSTSFMVTPGNCISLFIMSITEFVKDASVSLSRLLMPSITRHGRREYCSWESNFSRNISVTWFARASCDSKTTMLLSKWPSFRSRDVIFSFCFVMVSRSKTSSSCFFVSRVQWTMCSYFEFLGHHISCCFDADLVFLDFGVEGIVTVRYFLIFR